MRCNGGGAWSTARGIVTRVPVSSPSSRIGIQMCAHRIFQGFRLGLPISCPELDREALVRGRDPLHEQLIDSVILDRTVKVQIKKLVPLSDTCTLFSRLPVCASVSDNALAFFVAARPTGQNTRQRVLAVAFSALVGIGSRGGWDTRRTAEPADIACC